MNYNLEAKIRAARSRLNRSKARYTGSNPVRVAFRKANTALHIGAAAFSRKVYLYDLALVTSFRCNYNCEGCGQRTPQIKKLPPKKKIIDIDTIFRSLDRLLDSVDGIVRIGLANGEGFLNENLASVIEYVSKHPQIYELNIPTNGTIIPDKSILMTMRNHKVSATITQYPITPQSKIDAIISTFEQYNIRYSLYADREWFDTSVFQDVHDSEKANRFKFKHCERIWMLINNQELWRCVPYTTAAFTGEVEKRSEDYIDLLKTPPKDIRGKIKQSYKQQYLNACTMCHGYVGNKVIHIPAGEQIKN